MPDALYDLHPSCTGAMGAGPVNQWLSRRRRRRKPVCDNCLEIYIGNAVGFELERGYQVGQGRREFAAASDKLWGASLTKRSIGSFRSVADVRGS